MMTTTSSPDSSGDKWFRPYTEEWWRQIVDRATELLVEEDIRLEGIVFGIETFRDTEIALEVRGATATHQFFPRVPSVFRSFIRRSVEQIGPPLVLNVLGNDPHWPLLSYLEPEPEEAPVAEPTPEKAPLVVTFESPRYSLIEPVEPSEEVETRVDNAGEATEINPDDFRHPPEVLRRAGDGEEAVDHPAHYNTGAIEVIDAIEAWGLGEGFNRGNAIKYIARAGHKPGADELEDLEKAAWYLGREIERIRNAR